MLTSRLAVFGRVFFCFPAFAGEKMDTEGDPQSHDSLHAKEEEDEWEEAWQGK